MCEEHIRNPWGWKIDVYYANTGQFDINKCTKKVILAQHCTVSHKYGHRSSIVHYFTIWRHIAWKDDVRLRRQMRWMLYTTILYYTIFRVVLYGLHHFKEGLIDLVSLFPLHGGVIMIRERLKFSYYTVSVSQNHLMVFQ